MIIEPPPAHMMFDGPQDPAVFAANGEEFLRIYQSYLGIHPDASILDVGSGIGRKTIPLTRYLSAAGRYEGIDVRRDGVEWCQQQITLRYPNFNFQHVDVYAPGYNPGGKISPLNFEFPFPDRSFEFVTLCSVFTHMRLPDLRAYLAQVHRVLRIGGQCLITFFLLDLESRRRVHADKIGRCGFPFPNETGRVADPSFPEQAIAFHQQLMLDSYATAGLKVAQVRHGTWSGREGLSYQDIIIAARDFA